MLIIFFLSLLLAAPLVHANETLSAGTTFPNVAISTPLSADSTGTVEISTFSVITSPALHAIHLTSVAAGSKRFRKKLDKMLQETTLNAVVVDLKDEGGEVYVPGVKTAQRAGSYRRDIPDLAVWLTDLKKRK